MAELYGGLDLGGTKIYTIVATAGGEVRGEFELPSEADRGLEHTLGHMVESMEEAAKRAGTSVAELAAIAVAAPGPIDFKAGVITAAPNLGWEKVPLRSLLKRAWHHEVLLENDANAAALGEYTYGAGRAFCDMVYVTVSTGIGGGFVFDGRIYRGASGAAGEVGHITVEPNGPRCFCGNRGCLEIMASGTALGRLGTEAVAAGHSEMLREICDDPADVKARDVAIAAARGDPVANEILDEAARYLGIGLGSLINLVNPEAIVVGGGASKIGDRLLDPAIAEAKRRSFPQSFGDCAIRFAELGERVGALGAIAVATGGRTPIASS
jgi:glucokinase